MWAADIQKNLQSRQQLLQQSNENEMVLEVRVLPWTYLAVTVIVDVIHDLTCYCGTCVVAGAWAVRRGLECIQTHRSSSYQTGFNGGQNQCAEAPGLHYQRVAAPRHTLKVAGRGC